MKKKKQEYSVVTMAGEFIPYSWKTWLDIGDKVFEEDHIQFNSLPAVLYGAEWLQYYNRNSVKEAEFIATKKQQPCTPHANNIETRLLL